MLRKDAMKVLVTVVGALCTAPSSAFDLDPTIEHLANLIDRQQYRAVADTIAPFVETARAADDSLRLGRLTCLQGQAALGVGQVDRSLKLLQSARELAIAQRDTFTWMKTLGVGSFALSRQGRYEDAIGSSTRQMELAAAVRDTISEGFASLSIGYAELQLGHLDRARPAYRRAINRFSTARTSNWQLTAMVGLARIERTSNNLDEARTIYGEIIERAKEIGDYRNEVDALNNLAELELQVPRVDLADRYLRMALAVLNEVDADPYQRIVVVGNLLHRSELAANDESLLEELDALRAQVLAAGNREAGTRATLALARARRAQARYHAAGMLYDEARGFAATVPMRQLASIGYVEVMTLVEPSHELIGILDAEFNPTDGIPFTLRTRYAASRANLELQLGDVDAALATTAEFEPFTGPDAWSVRLHAFRSRALARSGEAAQALESLAAAIRLVEDRSDHMDDPAWKWLVVSSHGPIVVDAAAEILTAAGDSVADELFEQLQALKSRTLVEQLTREDADRQTMVDNLSRERAQSGLLHADELFLDYHVGFDRILMFAIDRERFVAHAFEVPAEIIEEQVRLAVELTVAAADGESAPVSLLDAAARSAGTTLLAPAVAMVGSAIQITVSPDGILASAPFGLLPDSTGEPLLLNHRVDFIPCLALRTLAREDAPGGGGIVTLVGRDIGTPGARAEVEGLRRRVRVAGGIEGLSDPMPDLFARAEVLHIAAHADVFAERPWFSGFRLEPDAQDPATGLLRPTHLRARDLLTQDLAARLAVLSTCESHAGWLSHGEGVIGMSTAFLMAGCESVISTLWPVDDAVTVDLMLLFYDGLANGLNASDALRQAQLEIRTRQETAHPFYWAGFAVVGNGDVVVQVRSRSADPWRTAGIVALGLIAFGALWMRRSRPNSLPV